MANLQISQETMDAVINFLTGLPWKQSNGVLQTLINDLSKNNAPQAPAPIDAPVELTPEVAPEAPVEAVEPPQAE